MAVRHQDLVEAKNAAKLCVEWFIILAEMQEVVAQADEFAALDDFRRKCAMRHEKCSGASGEDKSWKDLIKISEVALREAEGFLTDDILNAVLCANAGIDRRCGDHATAHWACRDGIRVCCKWLFRKVDLLNEEKEGCIEIVRFLIGSTPRNFSNSHLAQLDEEYACAAKLVPTSETKPTFLDVDLNEELYTATRRGVASARFTQKQWQFFRAILNSEVVGLTSEEIMSKVWAGQVVDRSNVDTQKRSVNQLIRRLGIEVDSPRGGRWKIAVI